MATNEVELRKSSIATRLRRKRTSSQTETNEKKKLPKKEDQNDVTSSRYKLRFNALNISIHIFSLCDENFFTVPCEQLAKTLLGHILCHKIPDSQKICRGRIVETEAYLGGEDKASHSYNGRRTPKNEAMYMKPGTCYVYSIYGIHCCMNISSKGDGAAVLLRALEPVDGISTMRLNRTACKKDNELCRGPAKLCQAMGISKTHNKIDMTTSSELWIETDIDYKINEVVSCARVGINYAEEWVSKPLRFYIKGNKCVSKK